MKATTAYTLPTIIARRLDIGNCTKNEKDVSAAVLLTFLMEMLQFQMSYHGYLPHMVQFVESFECPEILEIGVDLGQTLIPLLHALLMRRKKFKISAVDIKFNDSLLEILRYMPLSEGQELRLFEANSLDWLPKCDSKFHLVLLDGDHNYHTVHKELHDIQKNLLPNSIMICDDYSGRWAERDLWYADRPGYENNELASKEIDTQKHGVKPAVDDFVLAHPEWKLQVLMQGEPIVMYREIVV